ncbi:GH39 family glycosyl hydrolase [Cohnella caldifontis]|uniref:GH39 family glycosyl hydrolase n=1 Tax=Cohnella caldifontis TaxID=3027471 RepID=UPI0023EC8F8C|nr:hypothetical protein [Cohnella sp. YIM B05605]
MTEIRLHPDQTIGTIKPIHGVNNGPVTYGSLVDVSDYYAAAAVPLVRLHDPNWPHPREVDIHIVFPDFDKDPADPASYDFSQTDEYLRTVVATGARVVYRLGESIEHTATKYFVHPPKDYEKWARICIGIIRHYNQGWANGFYYNIEYWEIWNEPDYSVRMWSGTHEQYYRLYETASLAIKRFDPSLKVGGPAVANPNSDFVPEFLEHCRSRQLPLDFFSWHTYTGDPLKIARNARHIRSLLDRYGYGKTESHLNEWNYMTGDFATIWNKGNEFIRKQVFDRQKSHEGAAFVAQVLSFLQDLPVDQANYYDGQPTALFCGLFDYHGVPQKTYHAVQAFEHLRQHGSRIGCEITGESEGLSCLAARDADGRVAALISNFDGSERLVDLKWDAAQPDAAKMQADLIDEHRQWEPVPAQSLLSGDGRLRLPPYSVLYLRVDR